MTAADCRWVSKHVFVDQVSSVGNLRQPLKIWNYPPPVPMEVKGKPDPSDYFLRRLCLWMPRRIFKFDFKCVRPGCHKSLTSKGIYNKVRLVLDIKDYFYLATENLKCTCGLTTILAWDNRLLNQLPFAIRNQFPALLTYRYACDRSVITFLKSRTLGNSSHALHNTLLELHSEKWMADNLRYLNDCRRHQSGLKLVKKQPPKYEEAEPFKVIPTSRWLLSAFASDVWCRRESLKATVTSTFGTILKIDSTKKILRKLAGDARDSASWVTNVGNEYGAVLQSIVTISEANESLQKLADGIVTRYKDAKVEPPIILYTDRDCCSYQGASKFEALFSEWPHLKIKLDIWHYMRRIASGCTSEQHPLYSVFMSNLSGCIFEWDADDYNLLCLAKEGELKKKRIPKPSTQAIEKSIDKKELAQHCRRRTRGAKEVQQLIEQLILTFTGATDSLGVPLFKPTMVDVWNEQKRHLYCIQDPAGTQLYTKVSELSKGGISLPVYRCSRGSTSLESFHHHIINFIPGTSANAVNFQAYILEGLARWNIARKNAVEDYSGGLRSFNHEMISMLNSLSLDVHGKPHNLQQPPNKSTNELIGMEYLFSQIEQPITQEFVDSNVDDGIELDGYDSGVEDAIDRELSIIPIVNNEEEIIEDDEADDHHSDQSTDSRGIPGWTKVDRLARHLVGLNGISLTNSDVERIIQLYEQLEDHDKEPVIYKPVKKTPTKGRFASRKREGHTSQTLMKRCFLAGSSPALSPSRNRIVEAIIIYLCKSITTHRTSSRSDGSNRYDSRWKLIVQEYNYIRGRLFNSNLAEKTNLTLFNISETSLRLWYKNRTRHEEIVTLMQGKTPPGKRALAKDKLPTPTKSTQLQGEAPLIAFDEPEDRTGKAILKFGKTRSRPAQTPYSVSTSPPLDEAVFPVLPDPILPDPILPDSPQPNDIPLHIDTTKLTPPLSAPPLSTPPLSTPPTSNTEVISTISSSITAVCPVSSSQGTVAKKARKRKISSKVQQPTQLSTLQQPTQIFPMQQPIQPFPLQQPTQSFFPQRHPYHPIPAYQSFPQPFMYMPSYPNFPTMPIPIPTVSTQAPTNESHPKKERKKYTCRKCGQSEGHGQYKGQKYCPNQVGNPDYKTWLENKRREDKNKR